MVFFSIQYLLGKYIKKASKRVLRSRVGVIVIAPEGCHFQTRFLLVR